jgi:hypothetical protein
MVNEKGYDEQFWFRQSGEAGQEILNADGLIVAWTTNQQLAQVIVRLLNQSEEADQIA